MLAATSVAPDGRRMPLIELIPRASATAVAATIRAARQFRCDKSGATRVRLTIDTRIERAALSPAPGRASPDVTRAYSCIASKRNRRYRSGSFKSSCFGRCVFVVGFVVVQTHRGSNQAALYRAALVSRSGELLKPLLYRVALLRDGLKISFAFCRLTMT